MDGYTIDTDRPLGEGSFGRVYRAKHNGTGKLYAIKQIRFDIAIEGIPGRIMREVSIMNELKHKRVAKVQEVILSEVGVMNIIMEYADMDLRKYLNLVRKNNGISLPTALIQRFTRQLLKGLSYIHSHRVIHRDLKPSNLLIDAKQSLKIADFGLSRSMSVPAQTFASEVSTLWYRPPEVLLGDLDYTISIDMWSVGCIIAEMAREGEALFKGKSEAEQLDSIFFLLGTPNETTWPGLTKLPGWDGKFTEHETKNMVERIPNIPREGLDLVMQCLFYPPRYRLSAIRALLHPWLNKRIPPVFPGNLLNFYGNTATDDVGKTCDSQRTFAMPPTSAPAEDSIVERVQTFVGENRRIVIGAAVVAAAGVGYYVYSSSRGDKGGARPKDKKDKKAAKKSKGGSKLNMPDGPILEERGNNEGLTAVQIQALPLQDRLSRAAELKSKGNSAYTSRNFEAAAELYTQAIAMSPKPEAVFYSNRAACYTNLKPPQYERVIDDCTSALALDPKYAKALNRRAGAYEAIDKLEEALRDFTALAIIERFKNDNASTAVERVLAKLSSKQAEDIMRGRKPRLPSVTFINAYFSAFRERPHIEIPQEPTEGDYKLRQAQEALSASDYARAHELVNAAIDSGLSESWREGLAEALNLRGTFKFLMGDTVGAKTDLMESTRAWPDLIQSWVKIASVYMELNEAEAAFSAFESAIERDPKCADVYYHRGQVLFILSNFEKAAEDYEKSRELDPSFVFSHIQLAVAQYKMGNLDGSMETFRYTLRSFPDRGEGYNYYGELLLDQGRFQDAIEKFDRAIEIEKQRPMPNPLSLVNKALAIYQWQQDLATASTLCREALALDEECDAAVATLAQLSLQQGKVEDAVEMFAKHAEISRTEAELVQALSYANASRAQLEFQKNYPDMAGQLASMAAGMGAPM